MPILTAILSLPSTGRALFQQQEPLIFDQPVGDLPIVDDARWSAALTGNSWGALLVWVILLIVLHAVSWPLVRRVFTRFPDRGWAFARPVSILLAGYAVWLLASIQLISFRAVWAACAIIGLGLLTWYISRKVPLGPSERPIRTNPLAMTAEVFFWGTFGLFLLFRTINPDSYHLYWGGEKAMEFAHINSILRSAHFPPADPWYSDGFINYYYYGTYLVAFLTKLTGIPVEFAFNLAQPTFPALLASSAFSMSAALGRRVTGSAFGAWIAGIIGMFFVQFAGNFVAAVRVLDRAINGLGPVDRWSYWVWEPSRAIDYTITEFPYFGALYADLHPHVIAMPFTILILALAWQIASMWRAVPLMIVGRSINGREFLSVIVPLGLSALAIGTLFMTNAWDMPMFALIVAVGIIMLTLGMPGFWRRSGLTAAIIGVVAILSLLVTLPFNLNYVALFSEIDTVRDRTPLLSLESHLGAQLLLTTFGIGALVLHRSSFSRATQVAIGIAAPSMLVFFLFLQRQAHTAGTDTVQFAEFGVVATIVGIWLISAWVASGLPARPGIIGMTARIAIPAIAGLVIFLLGLERQTLALYAGIGLSAGFMWLTLRRPSERFLAMIIAGATLLGASLEIVYLVDNLSGDVWYRMNTVFKFYNQIWNLLGIATGVLAGYAVWHAFTYRGGPADVDADSSGALAAPRLWHWVTAVMVIPIMFATLAYGVVATPVRLDTRFAGAEGITLNAYDWMRYAEIPLVSRSGEPLDPLRYADDLEAINWMNENVHGTPVIAEAAFGAYRCNGSRFSIATGLPAVVGWVNHQTQQRPADDLWEREAALRELYTTTDARRQLEIIDRYDIDYVIVGQTERHYPTIGNGCLDTGSPEGIVSLESLEGDRLEVAFESGSTTIYRVIRD